jgi:hypothetical protein
VSGVPVADGGVLGTRGQGALHLPDQGWRDYTVDAVFRNPTGGVIGVRAMDDDNMVAYQFTPLRDMDNQLVELQGGEIVAGVVGGHLRPDLSQTVRSMWRWRCVRTCAGSAGGRVSAGRGAAGAARAPGRLPAPAGGLVSRHIGHRRLWARLFQLWTWLPHAACRTVSYLFSRSYGAGGCTQRPRSNAFDFAIR